MADSCKYGKRDLSGNWKLRWADGQRGAVKLYHLRETDEAKWMKATVPGEVHLELIRAGLKHAVGRSSIII